MNYIAEIKAFYDLVQVKQLSTGQVALWHALMCINNKCAWIEWFTAPNLTLELYTGLSRSGIIKARNSLKQLEIIDFRTNGTKATSYKLFTLLNSKQDSVQGSNQTNVLTSNSTQDSNQSSVQVGVQDSNQVGVQNGGTLIKLNKTKLNDLSSSSDHLDQNRDDDDDQFSEVAKEFGQVFGYPPNQTQAQMITSFLTDGLTTWHILEALKRAAQAGARSPTYVRTILQDWVNKRAFTPDDVKRLDETFKPKKARAGPQVFGDDYEYKPRDRPADGFFPWLDD